MNGEMPYRQETADCFAGKIGEGGLTAGEFDPALAATAPVLEDLRAKFAEASLPLLRLPAMREDLPALEALALSYRESFDDVIVLGTGGSSLGGRTLAALAQGGAGPATSGAGPATGGARTPRLHFMDNVDPASFAALFAGLEFARTGFVVISKSGATAETVTQFMVCIAEFCKQEGVARVAEHFTVITAPSAGAQRDNPLRRAAGRWSLPVLDHDPGVGGRYSALSLVGLLPAMIAGLDGGKVREGAKQALDGALDATAPDECDAAVGAAINVALLRHHAVSATVLMPYVDRLAPFASWFRQLWAESLGKDGAGTTPIAALGTVDQHSQLQLYLEGPNDKLFNLILGPAAGAGPRVAPDFAREPEFAYLAGRTMGDLLEAEQQATAETLARNGRPVRVFRLTGVDERVLGALMMHFMLETIITAGLLGVNPFDQPAVEEGKVLARRYLAKMDGG